MKSHDNSPGEADRLISASRELIQKMQRLLDRLEAERPADNRTAAATASGSAQLQEQ